MAFKTVAMGGGIKPPQGDHDALGAVPAWWLAGRVAQKVGVAYMRLRVLACLPCVATQPDVMELGDSRIVHVPFEEWLALEGQSRSAPYNKLDSKYNQDPPVFWEALIDVDPNLVVNREPTNTRTLRDTIEPELEALVKALHWYTGAAPIHPHRSVTYFDARGNENFMAFPGLEATVAEAGVQRSYGESEKEYATENRNPSIVLRQSDVAPFAAMVAFARQTRHVWMDEQYELASQSLGLCSAPGLGWNSQILLLVGAYEALLLPDRPDTLQSGFERRFCCMAADRFEELRRYVVWIKSAYRLRSDLIHGRPLADSLRDMPSHPGEYVAQLSRAGVTALCKLIRYRHAHPEVQELSDPLWALLDGAESDPAQFAALQDLIGPASALPVRHQWQVEGTPC